MLFSKKKKAFAPMGEKYILSLFDADMKTLYSGPIQEVPLPESLILACSEEFFNDPQPCEIHRRAVALRLYGEIIEAMQLNKTVACDEMPPRIGLCLRDVNPTFMKLEMK